MSIFGTIMDKIFHHPAASSAETLPATSSDPAASVQNQTPQTDVSVASAEKTVDVGAVLNAMAAQKNGGGDYEHSIVDLLKLLDLDSTLDARKRLGQELGVHAGADGSAEQNIALHAAVTEKLAQNGGTIPASMKNI